MFAVSPRASNLRLRAEAVGFYFPRKFIQPVLPDNGQTLFIFSSSSEGIYVMPSLSSITRIFGSACSVMIALR
jgi:hypothetical protein